MGSVHVGAVSPTEFRPNFALLGPQIAPELPHFVNNDHFSGQNDHFLANVDRIRGAIFSEARHGRVQSPISPFVFTS
jgi:hypothetical protein